eukprot:365743-Chlamydomonas_euryale.AAC.35
MYGHAHVASGTLLIDIPLPCVAMHAQKDIGKVDFALDSLVKSMRWDEETYGLEYDLELFNIVAVDDFNMGAMVGAGRSTAMTPPP